MQTCRFAGAAVLLAALFLPPARAGDPSEFDRTVAAFKRFVADEGLTGGKEEKDAWNDPPMNWSYSAYRPKRGFSMGIQVMRGSPERALDLAFEEHERIRMWKGRFGPLGVLRRAEPQENAYGEFYERDLAFVEGYRSPSGWAILRGRCHWQKHVQKSRGEPTGEVFERADAEIEVTGIQGGVRLRGSLGLHQTNEEREEWDLDNQGRHSVDHLHIERLEGEEIGLRSQARRYVRNLLPNAQRDDGVDVFRVPGVAIRRPNVIVAGTLTDAVDAQASGLQRVYDHVGAHGSDEELAAFEDRLADVQERARALDADVKAASGAIRAILLDTPGGALRREIRLLEKAETHWNALGKIATQSATAVNEKLLAAQETLSLNVLKSLFKNYVEWSGAIPGSPESLLTLLGGSAEMVPWDLPATVQAWRESAEKDAGILGGQATTISRLKELREFYLTRAGAAVDELRRLKAAREKRLPYAAADEKTEQVLRDLSAIRYQAIP